MTLRSGVWHIIPGQELKRYTQTLLCRFISSNYLMTQGDGAIQSRCHLCLPPRHSGGSDLRSTFYRPVQAAPRLWLRFWNNFINQRFVAERSQPPGRRNNCFPIRQARQSRSAEISRSFASGADVGGEEVKEGPSHLSACQHARQAKSTKLYLRK